MTEQVRLAKYFTDCGVLSRRAAEEEIKKGKVKVNGAPAELGAKIDPELEMFTNINNYMANVNLCMPTALSFDGLFTNEIAHFVDCVREGKTCVSPAKDGVEMMRILDAAYESARTGHEVIL